MVRVSGFDAAQVERSDQLVVKKQQGVWLVNPSVPCLVISCWLMMACRVGCARLCFIFFTRRGLFMLQLMVQSLVCRFLSLRYARKSSIVFTCSGWSARPAANLRYVSPSSEGQTWPIISHNLVHTLLDDGLLNLKDIPTLSFFFMSPRSRLARAVYRILSFFSSQSYAHIYLSIQDDSQPSVIESHLNEL